MAHLDLPVTQILVSRELSHTYSLDGRIRPMEMVMWSRRTFCKRHSSSGLSETDSDWKVKFSLNAKQADQREQLLCGNERLGSTSRGPNYLQPGVILAT